jgi:AcrR family transcriptional regulator
MRPLTEADRQQRRDALADLAAEVFATAGWSGLTIDAVAQAARISKGAVFLSFATKEDLMLHAVRRRFDAWFDRLSHLVPKPLAGDLARALLGSLRSDPQLLPLLALVGPVLEQGCSAPAVIDFKESLARHVEQLAEQWSRWTPGLPADAWVPVLMQLYALTVGCWSVGEASGRVRNALADRPDLGWLLAGFDELFVPLAEAQLHRLF